MYKGTDWDGQNGIPVQGIWTNSTSTRFERSDEAATPSPRTDRPSGNYDPNMASVGAYNDFWTERGCSEGKSNQTALIVDRQMGSCRRRHLRCFQSFPSRSRSADRLVKKHCVLPAHRTILIRLLAQGHTIRMRRNRMIVVFCLIRPAAEFFQSDSMRRFAAPRDLNRVSV